MSNRNYIIVNQTKCANCAEDKRENLSGICNNCFHKIRSGVIVKIRDNLDKDVYSCGCVYRGEGPYYCSMHNENNCP